MKEMLLLVDETIGLLQLPIESHLQGIPDGPQQRPDRQRYPPRDESRRSRELSGKTGRRARLRV